MPGSNKGGVKGTQGKKETKDSIPLRKHPARTIGSVAHHKIDMGKTIYNALHKAKEDDWNRDELKCRTMKFDDENDFDALKDLWKHYLQPITLGAS